MTDGTWLKCFRCKSDMWLPAALCESAKASREVINFYCAYGHSQVFSKTELEEVTLRRERDLLKQREAQLQDEIADERARRQGAEKARALAQKRLVALKERSATGTCPCCNRNFSALAQHIATKHPTFRAEDVTRENIVSLVKAKSA